MKIWSPGKVLLYGGYAILNRKASGLVLPVNKGVRVSIKKGENKVSAPDFGINKMDVFGEEAKKKIPFVHHATRNTKTVLEDMGIEWIPIELTTENDEGLTMKFGESKAGFGTSAGITVSTTAAILKFHGYDVDKREGRELVNKIAQYTHFMVQGKAGSGFDISCASFGPHFFRRASPELITESKSILEAIKKEWDNEFYPAEWPSYFYPTMAYTGKSFSTSLILKKLKEEGKMNLVEEFAEENEKINKKIRETWEKLPKEKDEKILKELKELLKESWRQRREFGLKAGVDIEPEEIRKIMEEMEKGGAYFATLPGAGGGDSIFAVSLSEEDRQRLWNLLNEKGLYVFQGIDIEKMGYREI